MTSISWRGLVRVGRPQGISSSARRCNAAEYRPERGGLIGARKRFILRNGDAQERAERHPPFLDVKDQEPIRGDRLLHCLTVLGKDGLTMRAIGQATTKDVVPGDVAPSS